MPEYDPVWTPCGSCDRDTKHNVLFSAEESESDYPLERSFQVVECCGCETKSFRKVISYIADAQQIDHDEWEVPKDVFTFPPVLKGHRQLPGIRKAPRTVKSIYQESLDAIRSQAYTLAGVGLRATIEAICNERSITGRNLEIRIDKLAKNGLASQADADRLHAIRFMGNDAAHEIQPAELEQLLVALMIIENLIMSIYVLDKEAAGVLETLVKTYAEFEKLLDASIAGLASGTESPLFAILGKELRRFHGYLRSHETQLLANIANGSYTKLSVGKVDHFGGSKEKLQHFIKP